MEKIKVRLELTKQDLLKIKKEKGYINLPILLSKLNINSSKELINDLCNNEQITKQVYNNLIKAITYK